MVTKIWVNIGSSNGLVPDGTKPSNTWTIVDLSMKFCGTHIFTENDQVINS